MDHISVSELLAVYALGACEAIETVEIESHLWQCPSCNAAVQPLKEAVHWLGVAHATWPPDTLRTALLQEARDSVLPGGSYQGGKLLIQTDRRPESPAATLQDAASSSSG
jgi:hypothetical protein